MPASVRARRPTCPGCGARSSCWAMRRQTWTSASPASPRWRRRSRGPLRPDSRAPPPPGATMHGGEGRGAAGAGATTERRFEVGQLTRVEGEGSLRLRVRGGVVVEARLAIFEAPRYFERLVVGPRPHDAIHT